MGEACGACVEAPWAGDQKRLRIYMTEAEFYERHCLVDGKKARALRDVDRAFFEAFSKAAREKRTLVIKKR